MPSKTRERQGEATLLDICLALHMSNTGSSDPLDVVEQNRLMQILRDAVRFWEPSVHSHYFDAAVLNLIRATIDETDTKMLHQMFSRGEL